QAEDGIRDFHVTGVQTCALPIYLVLGADALGHWFCSVFCYSRDLGLSPLRADPATDAPLGCIAKAKAARGPVEPATWAVCTGERSEERRVGKEGRGRGGRAQDNE